MDQSDYLRYLPGLLRGDGDGSDDGFLGGYLKIFEALLSGREDASADGQRISGLEDMINAFADYLDPALVPIDSVESDGGLQSEFLNYLADWVALSLDQNWNLKQQRQWLRRIVPLYKRRGTRDGLAEYLAVFVGNQVTVDEPLGGLTIAAPDNATLGVDTFIAGAPAYFFRVRINYGFGVDAGTDPDADSDADWFDITVWRNTQAGTRAIVDLEKPAHTYYRLDARTPGFIVGRRATIARNTLIWQNSTQI